MRNRRNRWLGLPAVAASVVYLASDGIELLAGGFSPLALWLSYGAFVVMPYAMLALHASASETLKPGLRAVSLVGAVLYGGSFIAYSATTLLAVLRNADNYGELASGLGPWYQITGGVMILGGVLFAAGVIAGRATPSWCGWLLLLGGLASAGIGLGGIDPNWQIAANTLRSVAIGAMGLWVLLGLSSAGR